MDGADLIGPIQFSAQPLHMGIQCAAFSNVICLPDLFEKGLTKERRVGILAKNHQQVKFLSGQIHPNAVLQHFTGIQIHIDIQQMEHALAFVVAPEHYFDAGNNLHHLKGLYNVILRTQLEPLDPVIQIAFGCKEDHRNIHGADVGQQIITVKTRQHDIQQHQVIRILF